MATNAAQRLPPAPSGPRSLTAAILHCWPALLFLFALPSDAQLFSFGVIGGVPITSAFTDVPGNSSIPASDYSPCDTCYQRLYIIGPTAEVRLPFHLAIEVDALYRRNGFVVPGFRSNPQLSAPVDDWQVPLLAKYVIKAGPLRPFVDGGVVYRHAGTASGSANLLPLDHPNSVGVAVGGGLTLKLGFLRLSPQIRYTYWPNPPLTISGASYAFSNKNQVDVLVGFTF